MSILDSPILNNRPLFRRLLPAQPCVLCGRMSHDGLWCADCDRSLPRHDQPCCPVCALPSPTGERCGRCIAHPPAFDLAVAAFSYEFPLDRLIQQLKFGERLALADAFAAELLSHIDRDRLPDCIVPMPLHPSRLRERGFNQSQLIAAGLARELGLELLPHACRRVRATTAQSTLPWKERKKNMRGAFECAPDMAGRHVALVDDVLTTGASLDALARAVKQRGAETVSVWVVARTIRKPATQAT